MNTKLEVIRLANEDVISTSVLCDLDDGTHIYIGEQCPNTYGVHPDIIRYFLYDGNYWNEGSESYLSGEYGSTDKGWYHLENSTYKKCKHAAPDNEPTACLDA